MEFQLGRERLNYIKQKKKTMSNTIKTKAS